MALLGSKAIIGFEEFYRLVIEQDSTLENIKREAVADLINAASLHIERYLQGPVITRQFTEYYHGQRAPTRRSPSGGRTTTTSSKCSTRLPGSSWRTGRSSSASVQRAT